MTYQKFNELLDEMYAEERALGDSKGKEYTVGEDRLDNFKRHAKTLRLTPKQILWIYFVKHIDSIASYVRLGTVLSNETIEARIKDARVYLSLLRGLIEEEKDATNNNERNSSNN